MAEDSKRAKRDKKPSVRIPIPLRPGRPHSTKKGKKGYDRKKDKKAKEELLRSEETNEPA
jgi:hypothetical protein